MAVTHASGVFTASTACRCRNRSKHVLGTGIITECLAHVHESIEVAGRKDETSAKLKRIFAKPVLANADGLRTFSGCHIVWPKKMKKVGILQFDSLVSLAILVDQQREPDAGLLAEMAGITCVAQPNRCQRGTPFAEFLLVFAQLRDVLSAEDSTVMPQKNDCCWSALPQ